jgi:hypothetical protein
MRALVYQGPGQRAAIALCGRSEAGIWSTGPLPQVLLDGERHQ